MALEPFYCFWDSVMEVIWDWVVVQHERLVFLVGWLSAKRVGTNASLEELEEEAGASKGRKARKAKPEKRRGASPEKEEAPGNQPAHREVNLPEKVEKAQEKAPSRAQRKLQQRREKAEAASVPQETKEDPPIDDSWIDELEARESKNKAKREQKCAKAKKRGAAACKADMCFDTDQILCEAMHGLYLLAREVGALEGCEEPEVEVPPAERPAAKRFKAEDTEKAEAKEATREEDTDPNGFEHRRSKKSASRRLQQQLSERTERSERAERVRVPERVEPVEEKRQKQKMEAKEPREPKEPKRREVPLANPLPANPRPANPAGPSRVMSQRSQMSQPSKQTKEPKESKESKEKEPKESKTEPKKPRAWSEVVAPWAKKSDEGGSRLGASAPEFVPLAQQLQELGVHDSGELGITTVRLAGLAPETTGTGLFQQLDCWGLGGSFDFLHIMLDGEGAYANINFIDPIFVTLFCYLCQEYQLHAEISVSEVQGIKALTAQWVQSGDPIQAVVVRNAMPSQWAVNAVNTLLSPQLKSQFRKTKLCAHNRRKRCEMGPDCPFAHCKEELQPMPNLAKTKICYNYFRRRCNEPNCKFAHGSAELRSPIFNWEASEGLWNPLGEAMHGFDFSGIDFSQMQAFPVDASMYYMQEQEEVQAFSAENGEQDNSILFEALPRKDEGQRGKVAVRVRRTFMEVTQVDGDEEDDDDMPIGTSMRRSFSDSHLETLKEGMDETEL
ncbi:unnamed protein product [Effrenium voratum]|nr:unnamed protein product [Effrenium voratum]